MKFVIILVAIGLIASIGCVVGQDNNAGYWKQTDVQYKAVPSSATTSNSLWEGSPDRAFYKTKSADGKERFEASFFWTVPEKIYASQEHFQFSITAGIEKYTYNGVLNFPNAKINMGFLPGLPFYHHLEDERKGKWEAIAYGELGVIKVPDETLLVAGMFPPGRKNGEEKMCIQCNAGQVIYIYKWIDEPMPTPPTIAPPEGWIRANDWYYGKIPGEEGAHRWNPITNTLEDYYKDAWIQSYYQWDGRSFAVRSFTVTEDGSS
ncbi:MAG: hypothetical protein MUO26_08155 [Methanotrichaceae archaeon]|nr:hypothetical protein [Methanotrichaceae archaeon]